MGQALLLAERYVLEAIISGADTIDALEESSGMSFRFLERVLGLLKDRGVIFDEQGRIGLNRNDMADWAPKINSPSNLEQEISELLSTWSKAYFHNKDRIDLKLKKVNLSESERQLLEVLLRNIDEFIKDVELRNRNEEGLTRTSEKTLLLWGKSRYRDLLENNVSSFH